VFVFFVLVLTLSLLFEARKRIAFSFLLLASIDQSRNNSARTTRPLLMLRTLAARALGGASATTSGSLLSSSSLTAGSESTTFFSSLFLSSSRSYASSVPGSSEADFGLAAGVPEHLLKREVRE